MARIHALLALGLFGLPLCADQLVLKNGDRISGKVVKKDGDSVSFKSDLVGDVTVKWADITELKSDEPLYVVLPSGNTVSGKVQTQNGQLQVATATAKEEAPAAEEKAIRNADEEAQYNRHLHPPIWDLWSGFIDLGLALARGNSQTTTLTTGFNATRVTGSDKIVLYMNQIYARGVVNGLSVDTANAIRGGWSYDRNLNKRLFVNIFNDYEHDVFQNLDLRFVAGGGAGYHAYKSDRGLLDLTGGVDYERENYSASTVPVVAPGYSRDSAEGFWGDDFAWKLSNITALKQSFRMFDNLSQTGEYRMNFDLGLDTKLNKWLAWQITASDRYLTNPAPGRKTNDLLITSGIHVTFAQ
jgi:putative salt-induced outer membrane protein YdiY